MKKQHIGTALLIAGIVAGALALTAGWGWAKGLPGWGVFAPSTPPDTAFTYQGELSFEGQPINAPCTMTFSLYDGESQGLPVGDTLTATVPISDGLFTVALDFGGSAFTGDARWLGVQVQCPGDAAFTDLGREKLTAAPYAMHASSTGALHGHPITTTGPITGQVLGWDGAAWGPVTVDDTAYTAGYGLTLNGTAFSVVTSTVQQRVTGTCGSGYAIREVREDGTVVCEPLPAAAEVRAGEGLTRTASGDAVTLTVAFDGSGSAGTVARSDHEHDARYYTEDELSTDTSAEVHWDNLIAMPGGFSDGSDDVDDTVSWAEVSGIVGGGSNQLAEGDHGHAGSFYANLVVVAQSGGDFTSVQAAIDSISGASAASPYLVWVAPGRYTETVTMKPHVHLRGAGQDASVITSDATDTSSRPSTPGSATLILASNVVLSDLTLENTGNTKNNIALLAVPNTTDVLVDGVKAWSRSSTAGGVSLGYNYGIYLDNQHSEVVLQDVNAVAENAKTRNIALFNAAKVTLRGGTYFAYAGVASNAASYGIENYGYYHDAIMEADSTIAVGQGTQEGVGFYTWGSNAEAVLRDSHFTGQGGSMAASGVEAQASGSITLENCRVVAENSLTNYAIDVQNNGVVKVYGGHLIARGGSSNRYGIRMVNGQVTATQCTVEAVSYTLYILSTGSINISNARLIGGPTYNPLGSLTCTLVTRGTTVSTDGTSCP